MCDRGSDRDHGIPYPGALINRTLSEIRREKNEFSRQEQEFKKQIENISHDLRTPLTSILGYLKLMDMESMPEEERENLDTVRRKAEALSRLIGQFYDYSRVTSGDYQPELEEMDLCRLLREMVLDSWKEIEEKHLDFSFHLPGQPVMMRGMKTVRSVSSETFFRMQCVMRNTVLKSACRKNTGA